MVVNCLGHNITLKGIYGHPRHLALDATKRICNVSKKVNPTRPTKFILMGTVAVPNPDGSDDTRSWKERALLSILRVILPPHADNEQAASFLSKDIGVDDPLLKWVIVRPDALREGPVSIYDVFDKPQNELFGAAETTRSNVAHFMTTLIEDETLWKKWQGKMPVPLNKKSPNT